MSNAPQSRRGGMFIENTFKYALEPRRGGMFIEYVAPTELKRIIAFAINISFRRNSRCKIGLKKPSYKRLYAQLNTYEIVLLFSQVLIDGYRK